MKLAIIILCDSSTIEGLARVSNAFYIAAEAQSHDVPVEIAFQGAGARWIGELEKPDHKLHPIYMEVKKSIKGVCLMCANAFGVSKQITEAGFNLIDDYREHTSVYQWMKDGYTILTF